MRIENYSAEELFDQLNDIDETQAVEAKALSQDSTRSLRPILYKLVSPNGPLYYTHPEMLHHPLQAYVAKASGVETIKKVTEEVTEKVIEKDIENQRIGRLQVATVEGTSKKTDMKTSMKTGMKTGMKTADAILVLLCENADLSIDGLAAKLNRARSSVVEQIAKLKQAGKLRRIGPDKGGHWEVVK